MTTKISLQQQLEADSGKKIRLKINDNSSTMLSVRWEPDLTRVSLHKMFLQAPQNIMQALACYIKQGNKPVSPLIKIFIDDHVKKLDYSHLVDPKDLCAQGEVFNLQAIFDSISEEYFDQKLPLKITWFGKPNQRNRTRVTFGLYHDPRKLIKIHRLLDNPTVPEFLVKYVVYHEMLHYVCPAYRNGHRQCIHSREFKQLEKKFRFYNEAQEWIKENKKHLFYPPIRKFYGWPQ